MGSRAQAGLQEDQAMPAEMGHAGGPGGASSHTSPVQKLETSSMSIQSPSKADSSCAAAICRFHQSTVL